MHSNLVKRGVSRIEGTRIIRDFTNWPIVDNTWELLETALSEQARWQLSLWDSLILSAARASGASELITENLSHGQNYGVLKAINPFL